MKYLAWGFASLSLSILAFVSYLHVTGAFTLSNELRSPFVESFESTDSLERLSLAKEGPCTVSVRDGVLSIRGSSGDSSGRLCRVKLVGTEYRLTDLLAQVQFQVGNVAPVDVMVGFEDANSPGRTVMVTATRTPTESYVHLMGYPSTDGDVPEGGVTPEIESFLRAIRIAYPDDSHSLTLRLSPDVFACLVSVDGIARANAPCRWKEGTPLRPALIVQARDPGHEMSVDINEVRYEQAQRATTSAPVDIHDRFRGAVLDPAVWRVGRLPTLLTEEVIETGENGLSMRGRIRRKDELSLISNWFAGPTVETRSFRLRVRYQIRTLKGARLYVGVTNIRFHTPLWRVWDVAVTGGADGKLRPSFLGHWQNTGQFDEFVKPVNDTETGTIELTYDQRTRQGIARLNGQEIGRRVLDLQPLEPMQVHFGGHLLSSEGEFDLSITDLDFEQTGSRW